MDGARGGRGRGGGGAPEACLLHPERCGVAGHPDFRSGQAFQQVLSSPYVGIDHPGRVFLALAVEGNQVVLRLIQQGENLVSDTACSRFAALGRACGKAARIEPGSEAAGEGTAVL